MSLFSADTEIDLVTRRDPKQIRGRRFARVRKGYDPDQVRDFLDEVATWMERLESDLLSAQDEAEANARRSAPDPYQQMGSQLAELMRGAEEHAAKARQDADEEAAKQLAEAKRRAEEIRSDAQAQAKRLRTEAQEDAERFRREAHEEGTQIRAEAHAALERARAEAEATLAGLTGERERLLSEVRGARQRLSAALTRLDEVLDEADSLGPEDEAQQEPPSSAPVSTTASVAVDAPAPEMPGPGGEEIPGPRAEDIPGPRDESAGSLLGLDARAEGPEDPFEWPELPSDPWEFTAELDRQLFGDRGAGSRGRHPSTASLFDEDAEFNPDAIDIQIPDIPLIEDRNHGEAPPQH
jgi:DivIVA domain-containing protein